MAYLVGRIRERFPKTHIVLRGDSGFARDALMDWCETNGAYYILGLAKNARLLEYIETELEQAKECFEETERAAV